MKKLLILFFSLAVIAGIVSGTIIMANGVTVPEPETIMLVDNLKIGNYFTLGKYKDEPIPWRYAVDDEHGKLIVSDKILCYKTFGNDRFWEESAIRKWLNSSVSAGEVDWAWGLPSWMQDDITIDENEKGFLHDSNFSQREKSVLKTVTQWTMLPKDHLDLATNGNDWAYTGDKGVPSNSRDGFTIVPYEISELIDVYSGAAYETTDTIFLMDEIQAYRMWENLGDVKALNLEGSQDEHGYYGHYYLRTPTLGIVATISKEGKYGSIGSTSYPMGIRPAFYLDTDNAEILSGSGTEDDPYVLNGKSVNNNKENSTDGKKAGISVFCNGLELEFDVPPVIQNARTLVPFRTIFEALGAEVSWDEETQTVTGKLNETTIQLTIGSDTADINEQPVLLDAPPRIMNDRTLVPLRFISENFGFKVDWNEEEQRIDISM